MVIPYSEKFSMGLIFKDLYYFEMTIDVSHAISRFMHHVSIAILSMVSCAVISVG